MFKSFSGVLFGLCLILCLTIGASADAGVLTLHHRYLGADASVPFTVLGTIEAGSDVLTLSSSSSISQEALDGKTWYQVAVAAPGVDSSEWVKASTRACFVKADQPVHITLHYPTGSQTPDAVIVKAEGTPRDGSCPALTQSSRTPTTYQIHSKTPVKIQGPNLAPPIPVDPNTGTVAEPVEKTFFQKYWMYLLAAGLVASTLFGEEPPAKK